MQRESSSPNTLSFRETLGAWVWIVVPLILAGIGWAFGPLIGSLPKMARESWQIVVPVLVFLGVAAWQYNAMFHEFFGCWGLTLDRARGVAVTRYGLFWPRERQTIPLAGVPYLTLRRVEYRRARHVDVWHEIGALGNLLGRARGYGAARAIAEECGAFLKLPVHDYTSGEERVLAVDGLGQGLRAQLGTFETGEPPQDMKSAVERRGDCLVITPPDERAGCLRIWFGLSGVAGVAVAALNAQGRDGRAQAIGIGGTAGLFLALFLAMVPYRERFEAGPDGLYVEQKGLLLTGRHRFTAAQLTDITPGDGDIQVVAGGRSVAIASGRSAEERAWIARALKAALIKRAG